MSEPETTISRTLEELRKAIEKEGNRVLLNKRILGWRKVLLLILGPSALSASNEEIEIYVGGMRALDPHKVDFIDGVLGAMGE